MLTVDGNDSCSSPSTDDQNPGRWVVGHIPSSAGSGSANANTAVCEVEPARGTTAAHTTVYNFRAVVGANGCPRHPDCRSAWLCVNGCRGGTTSNCQDAVGDNYNGHCASRYCVDCTIAVIRVRCADSTFSYELLCFSDTQLTVLPTWPWTIGE